MTVTANTRRDKYYKTLGLGPMATKDEIRAAYKALAMKWHPDRHQVGKEDAQEKFIQIQEAYRELMAERPYDRHAQGSSASSQKVSSIFRSKSPSHNPKPPQDSKPTTTSSHTHHKSSRTTNPVPSSKPPPLFKRSNLPAASKASGSSHKYRPEFADEWDTGRQPRESPSASSSQSAPPPYSTSVPPLFDEYQSPRRDEGKQGFRPLFSRLRQKTRLAAASRQPGMSKTPINILKPGDGSQGRAQQRDMPTPFSPHLFEYAAAGPDARTFPLDLSLEEMFYGTHYDFHVTQRLPSGENKELRVELDVPSGCHNGTKIRCCKVRGGGKDSATQDVVFLVDEKPHDRFTRVKDDLFMEAKLPWEESLLHEDGELCVRGVDGTEYAFPIPYASEGLRKGRFSVIGAGMPVRRGGKVVGRGDLIVGWELVVMPASHTNYLKRGHHHRP